jgi:ABC-2 type transport system permease protein
MPPLSASELTAAIIAGAATRGLMVGAITAATCAAYMALFGAPMAISDAWAVLYFSAIAAVIFGAIGTIGGIWADKFDQMAAITNFVITPLTFLSGTFYSVANLPEPFRTLSHYNPVYYLIDGFRSGFTGVAEAPIWIGASSTFVLALVFTLACYLLIRSGYKLKD